MTLCSLTVILVLFLSFFRVTRDFKQENRPQCALFRKAKNEDLDRFVCTQLVWPYLIKDLCVLFVFFSAFCCFFLKRIVVSVTPIAVLPLLPIFHN